MIEDRITHSDRVVKKSNAISRAKWKPQGIWDARIVALVASKVHIHDEDFLEYKISVAELVDFSDDIKNLNGELGGCQYKEIEKSILHLQKATIVIRDDNSKNFRSYNFFSMCGYENGYIVARFDPDLKPHYLNLKKHFTQYKLTEYLKLRSTYSQQLFEFLKSWEGVPEVIISLDELHEKLNTPVSYRSNFKDARKAVFEVAHKEINSQTDLKYEWEPSKKGKAVAFIRFVYNPRMVAYLKKKEEQEKAEKEKKKKKIQSKKNNEMAQKIFNCFSERAKEKIESYECDDCPKKTCSKSEQEYCYNFIKEALENR